MNRWINDEQRLLILVSKMNLQHLPSQNCVFCSPMCENRPLGLFWSLVFIEKWNPFKIAKLCAIRGIPHARREVHLTSFWVCHRALRQAWSSVLLALFLLHVVVPSMTYLRQAWGSVLPTLFRFFIFFIICLISYHSSLSSTCC
jgi:hypothetical protein